jgi:cytochrome c oxidase subunit I+III
MSAFCAARHVAGKLDRVRVASLENTALLLDYMVAQTLIGLLLIHGFPRVMGAA